MPEQSCLIDAFGPIPVVEPVTVAEVSSVVRRAAHEGQAIYPLGGRTMLDLGLPPSLPGLAVSTTALGQVIDYPARDMTVTVQAGITMARLQELLRSESQRLPVDVPQSKRATLGGALATNVSGPRRYGLGTFRDYVIGITVVNDEGHEVKAGGRVVKNVAGYDLCKLYIGSLGTLGLISQVTLKLRPLPEEQALVVITFTGNEVDSVLDLVHRSRTRPVCMELLNRAAVRCLNEAGELLPDAPWVVVVGFEDNRAAVGWQVEQLAREVSSDAIRAVTTRLGPAAEPLWHALIESSARTDTILTFKANLLPRAVADFSRQAIAQVEGVRLQAHAGSGIVIGQVPGDLTLERAVAMLKGLQTLAALAEGNVIVLRCPPAWKRSLPVWGVPRGDGWLMQEVKGKLDPRRLFNPGRFVHDI
jgi:glycolate oxidase FAD binding subunit